jgi:hypothetical protein
MEKALLEHLKDSLAQWHELLDNLEGNISLSQTELAKASTNALIPVHTFSVVTKESDVKKTKNPTTFSPHTIPTIVSGHNSFLWIPATIGVSKAKGQFRRLRATR